MLGPGSPREAGTSVGVWHPREAWGRGAGMGEEQLGLNRVPPGSGSLPRPRQRSAAQASRHGVGDWPEPVPSSLRCESQGTPALHLPVPASSPGCSRPVGLQRGRGVCDREAKAAVTMAAGAQGSPQRMRLCPCLPQRGFQGSAATRGGEVKGQLSRQQQPPQVPAAPALPGGGTQALGGGAEPQTSWPPISMPPERVGHQLVPG